MCSAPHPHLGSGDLSADYFLKDLPTMLSLEEKKIKPIVKEIVSSRKRMLLVQVSGNRKCGKHGIAQWMIPNADVHPEFNSELIGDLTESLPPSDNCRQSASIGRSGRLRLSCRCRTSSGVWTTAQDLTQLV